MRGVSMTKLESMTTRIDERHPPTLRVAQRQPGAAGALVFVGEPDPLTGIGTKGVGEVGLPGTAAAIANTVYHRTGRRIRSLPITIDQHKQHSVTNTGTEDLIFLVIYDPPHADNGFPELRPG
jgi:hypothetical protein